MKRIHRFDEATIDGYNLVCIHVIGERIGYIRNGFIVETIPNGMVGIGIGFMGEHAMQCKGGVFYDCLTRVPLLISWPGAIPSGAVDESMVNLIDIVPTLLTLQAMAVPRAMQGQPLPTITDTAPRTAAFSEYGAGGPPFRMTDLEQLEEPWGRRTLMQSLRWREAEGRRKMVRTREWKYVHDPMGDRDELYDLVNDPWELTNVVAQPEHTAALAELRLRLADWAIETEDGRPVPLPD